MPGSSYQTKRIDHLGLVAGFCQEVGIADTIDAHLPNQSNHRHISYGQLMVAMLLNGLGFVSRTLHMFPAFFADKPIERLLGEGIQAEHINDDALGRCLDKLYELGVSELYQVLAEKVVAYLGLPCQSIYLDATSFHVDGDYAGDIDAQTIRLAKGYSRDHRPDLNQGILNLITENQAGLPIYRQACSGNTNDTANFKKLIKAHLGSMKAAQHCRYWVGDAALYSGETLQTFDTQQRYFITRVPQTLSEAKAIAKQASTVDLTPLENGYQGAWFDVTYAGVTQKWLLVKSEQAHQRAHHQLKRTLLKRSQAAVQSFNKLCRQTFACEADAQQALRQ